MKAVAPLHFRCLWPEHPRVDSITPRWPFRLIPAQCFFRELLSFTAGTGIFPRTNGRLIAMIGPVSYRVVYPSLCNRVDVANNSKPTWSISSLVAFGWTKWKHRRGKIKNVYLHKLWNMTSKYFHSISADVRLIGPFGSHSMKNQTYDNFKCS